MSFNRGYSGLSLKGHLIERTPLYKGHKFLAANTMNVCNTPSRQSTHESVIRRELFGRKGVLIRGEVLYTYTVVPL